MLPMSRLHRWKSLLGISQPILGLNVHSVGTLSLNHGYENSSPAVCTAKISVTLLPLKLKPDRGNSSACCVNLEVSMIN